MEKGKSRKVFLSFLGTGKYEKCFYIFEKEKSKNVKFVQNAIVEICKDKFDKKFVLCTTSAKNTHYNSLVNEIGYNFEAVDISENMSEKGIWEIFQQIYDVLNENDEIVFDITHSFRFMPMLGITLLQMAKFLKNIKVKKVFYGAYEPIKFNDGITEFPLVDLTSFSMLQDWILAGYTLVNTGRAEEIKNLAENDLTPILRETKGGNKEAVNLKKIADKIQNMTLNFRTNRGSEIITAHEMKEINEKAKEIEESNLLKPFKLLIENIHLDTVKFEFRNEENIIHGIQWCIDKDLVQQGMTMLQEGITTLVLKEIGKENKYTDINTRDIISHVLQVLNQKNELEVEKEKKLNIKKLEELSEILNNSLEFNKEETLQKETKKLKKMIEERILKEKVLNIEKIKELSKIFSDISGVRNDINHAGFRPSPTDAKNFKVKLEEEFEKFKEIWENKNNSPE
nr:TIGR02221 family CRISPR-associated protein [uncultured Leptotrichia sp.]